MEIEDFGKSSTTTGAYSYVTPPSTELQYLNRAKIEMTVAEAIRVLEVKKHDILMAGFGEEEE